MKGDAVHAILPLTTVRVVLLGPTGSLEAGARVDRGSTAGRAIPSPQDFMRAMGGGSSRGAGGRSGRAGGPSAGVAAGPLGAVTEANNESDNEAGEPKQAVFFLKYAEADSIFDITNNRIIVLGRTADHETIKATIKAFVGKE